MIDRQVANHIANLGHKDPNMRRQAANALGEIGDPVAVPALIASLNDQTEYVRRKAAISLKRIGAPAVPALAQGLKSGEELVRNAAFDLLMEFGDASAIPALIEALKSDNLSVRKRAVQMLEKVGDASAVPALAALLRDKYDAFWRNKYDALEREQSPFVPVSAASTRSLEEWFAQVQKPSKHDHDQVRCGAVVALGRIGDPGALPALIEALVDEDCGVRCCAAEALGRIGELRAVPALVMAWHARKVPERYLSYAALRKIGEGGGLPRKILADARLSAQERVDMLEKLRRVYGIEKGVAGNRDDKDPFPATPLLCQAVLGEENADARRGALAVLNWLNGEQHLLHASQADLSRQAQELVRPSRICVDNTAPETLMRAAETSEISPQKASPPPALWQRLFGSRNNDCS